MAEVVVPVAKVPPVPLQIMLADDTGMVSPAWAQWFRQLFQRVGGFQALSNTALASQTSVASVQNAVTGQGLSLQSIEVQIIDLQKGPVL